MVLLLKQWKSRSSPGFAGGVRKLTHSRCLQGRWGRMLAAALLFGAGWSSPVARQAHNLKVAGSNPAPATNKKPRLARGFFVPRILAQFVAGEAFGDPARRGQGAEVGRIERRIPLGQVDHAYARVGRELAHRPEEIRDSHPAGPRPWRSRQLRAVEHVD